MPLKRREVSSLINEMALLLLALVRTEIFKQMLLLDLFECQSWEKILGVILHLVFLVATVS